MRVYFAPLRPFLAHMRVRTKNLVRSRRRGGPLRLGRPAPPLAPSLRSSTRSCGARKAEAAAAVAVAREVPEAVRGAAVPRVAEPATAAQDTVIARSTIAWINGRTY